MATSQAKRLSKLAKLEALKGLEVQKEQEFIQRKGLCVGVPSGAPAPLTKAATAPHCSPARQPQSQVGYPAPEPTAKAKPVSGLASTGATARQPPPTETPYTSSVASSKAAVSEQSLAWQDKLEKTRREAEAEAALARESEAAERSQIWNRIGIDEEIPEMKSAPSGTGASSMHEPTAQLFARVHRLVDWNFLKLPTLKYMVVRSNIIVRAGPNDGAVSGRLEVGRTIQASEETFDGWVKLVDQPGWAPRLINEGSAGAAEEELLEMIGVPELMAVPELCVGGPSRRMFEVIGRYGVSVLREPKPEADVVSSRHCGEFVLAETQTYHGWVRVADGGGWMLSWSAKDGHSLRSVSAVEHRDTLLALPAPEETEEVREELRKKEEQEQQERLILKQLEEEDRREALEDLEAAVQIGDPPAFYAALKAARQQGVGKKDIARMHALFTAG